VRNVSIIAHVDHGKTTLADSLLSVSGKLRSSTAGEAVALDSTEEERRRGITISASAVNLVIPLLDTVRFSHLYASNLAWETTAASLLRCIAKEAPGNFQVELADVHSKRGYAYLTVTSTEVSLQQFLAQTIVVDGRDVAFELRIGFETAEKAPRLNFNMIDCPGHSDLVAEVHSSLRVSDGAFLIVDATEGVKIQTEKVLLSALKNGVKPLLFLNKLDRFFMELQLDSKEIVERLEVVIHDVNTIIGKVREDWMVSILNGTVLFGSGFVGWCCSLEDIIQLRAQESQEVLRLRSAVSSKKGLNVVLSTSLAALAKLHRIAMRGNFVKLQQLFAEIGLKNSSAIFSGDLEQSEWKRILRACFKELLPVGLGMARAAALSLPSPVMAQSMQGGVFFKEPGSIENLISSASREGRIIAQVVKGCILPSSGKGVIGSVTLGFIARILSGTVRSNSKLVLVSDKDNASVETSLTGIRLIRGIRETESVDEVAFGNVCVLLGLLDSVEARSKISSTSFTLCESALVEEVQACEMNPILHAKPLVKAVVGLPKSAKASTEKTKVQKRLMECIAILSRIDPCLDFTFDAETREMVISASGELHLEVTLASLRQLTNAPSLEMQDPVVSRRETIIGASSTVLSKASNKLNRIFVRVEPLDDDALETIESGRVDSKQFSSIVGVKDSKRIWATGPLPRMVKSNECQTCFLINATESVQNINDIRGSVMNAFEQFCLSGPLAGESLRGVVIHVVDAKVHTDPAHRRPNEIVPMVLNAFKLAMTEAQTVLVQPQLLASVQSSSGAGRVLEILRQSNAQVRGVFGNEVEALIDVQHSFGLAAKLNAVNAGLTFTDAGFRREESDLVHR